MKIDAAAQTELLQAVEKLRSFIENLEVKKSCLCCYHWSGGCKTKNGWEGKCKLYDATPPQEVIANGCEEWKIFDEIPF